MKFVLVSLLAGLAVVLPSAEAQVGNGRIAYTGAQGTFTVNPDGSGRTPLPGAASLPLWSPDGSRLAYSRSDPPGLVVAGADGQGAHNVAPGFIVPGSWSPDGTRLAFLEEVEIYTASAAGGDVRQLTFDGATKGAPVWSPSGGSIVYPAEIGRGPEAATALFVVEPDGGDPIQVTRPDTAIVDEDPVWSPTGSTIAFARLSHAVGSPLAGGGGIYLVRPDGTELHRVADVVGYLGQPAWSPDGTKLAFSTAVNGVQTPYGPAGADVYVIDADGSDLRRVTRGHSAVDPVWSPDGTQLGFIRNRHVSTVNADGTCDHELNSDDADDYRGPTWQPVPDGRVRGAMRCHAVSVTVEFPPANAPFATTATVRNDGTEPLTHVVLRIGAARGLTLITRSRQGCKRKLRVTTCPIGPLGPGAQRVLSFSGEPRRVGLERKSKNIRLDASFEVRTAESLLYSGRENQQLEVTPLRCSTRDPGRGRIDGTHYRDKICGRRGADQIHPQERNDLVSAGGGDDAVFARDGTRDRIFCGPGRDRVVADRKDRVARDCERVTRR